MTSDLRPQPRRDSGEGDGPRLPASLRERLRADTASRHDQVDRMFSQLDLREKDPLVDFLRVQDAALRAIRVRTASDAREAEAVRDEMVRALDTDLRHLHAPRRPAAQPVELDATAVRYVLLGSRMGIRVLRQRWARTTDPAVAGADRTFGLTSRTAQWRQLCDELGHRRAHDGAADALVGDANRVFDLYLATLTRERAPAERLPGSPVVGS